MQLMNLVDRVFQDAEAVDGAASSETFDAKGCKTVAVTCEFADVVAPTAAVKLRSSLDGAVWFDEGSSQEIADDTPLVFEVVDPTRRFFKLEYTVDAGSFTVTARALCKGLV